MLFRDEEKHPGSGYAVSIIVIGSTPTPVMHIIRSRSETLESLSFRLAPPLTLQIGPRDILGRMRGPVGCLTGCLTKLVLMAVAIVVFLGAVTVALNPWALHIGGRSTPLLYWHGAGTVVSKDGRTYPLYVTFWPDRPSGFHGGGRREGKRKNADLDGTGW